MFNSLRAPLKLDKTKRLMIPSLGENTKPGIPIIEQVTGPKPESGTNKVKKQGRRQAITTVILTLLGLNFIISKAALPSSFKPVLGKRERNKERETFLEQHGNHCQKYTLKTEAGPDLDAMAIFNDGNNKDNFKNQNAEGQKWIILFNSNGVNYESQLEFAKEYGEKVGVNILVFNYRGVGDSKGNPTCGKDLVQDGIN